ncbi:MAG: winged helix-turn-helix transcriptional regulator [Candidatus Kerfeldbacteria bacterium]|nr:winged helix-turn-helix transcriptional regulator [Candidatus Kerfeldbacteria bacterium]
MKPYRVVERIMKGCANHRRVEIMNLLSRNADLPLFEIAGRLKINFKTASEHLRRLFLAGLVNKHNKGSLVCHSLTNQGKNILKFLRTLE